MYYFPSTWRRLAAHFVDHALITLMQMPVWIAVVLQYIRTDQLQIHWAHLVYLILVSILYETVCLAFFSTTIGKWQWNLKVISRQKTDEDKSVTFEQALVRTLIMRFSFFFGWSIFGLAFFKYNRTHLADWIAGTQVVGMNERARPTEVRWVLAIGILFLTVNESLRSATVILNSLHWKHPYVYFNNDELRQFFADVELSIEYDDED